MDLELRKRLIPDRSVISTAPAIDPADDFYTGNGHYWLECAGGVEKDTFIITEEHLFEPLWKKTPEPPDLRDCIDKIRNCVLQGNPDQADEYIDPNAEPELPGEGEEFKFNSVYGRFSKD